MKKEDLLKLGLSEEDAKKVADASAEELKGYIPKSRFDEVNNEKKKLELDVRDRDSQLETLKNSTGDVEAMKKQIETLQADNKAKDKAHAAEIKQLKVDAAVSAALTAAKAKNEKAVRALLELDLEKVEFADDGKVKGLDDQIKKLVEAEETKFLFDTDSKKTKIKGANPGETGKEDPDTKVDISKMSYEELAAYLDENPDAEI
ncbi:MAG: phage scaffolding protein [Clostridium argentinense]|nr:phage scaffolding protein [Clostridium argentinense]